MADKDPRITVRRLAENLSQAAEQARLVEKLTSGTEAADAAEALARAVECCFEEAQDIAARQD